MQPTKVSSHQLGPFALHRHREAKAVGGVLPRHPPRSSTARHPAKMGGALPWRAWRRGGRCKSLAWGCLSAMGAPRSPRDGRPLPASTARRSALSRSEPGPPTASESRRKSHPMGTALLTRRRRPSPIRPALRGRRYYPAGTRSLRRTSVHRPRPPEQAPSDKLANTKRSNWTPR